MGQLTPLIVVTGFSAVLFLFLPCFIRKGPNQGIIRCSIYLTVFSMWIFWATVYISQMHPLIGPNLNNSTLIWMNRAENKKSNDTASKKDAAAAPDAAAATTAAAAAPETPATDKTLRMRPHHCINQPDNLFHCCNIPWLPKSALDNCMTEPLNVLTVTCDQARCAFREAGWHRNHEAVAAYYEEVLKFKPEWDLALENIRSECLETKPEYQGAYITCPEYDIIYCAMVNMLKHSPLSTWSTAAACIPTRLFSESCPICPAKCNQRDLKENFMVVCQACFLSGT